MKKFMPMGRKIRATLLICLVLMLGTQLVSAVEDQGLTVYNSRLVTNDKDATFIEGEVSVAEGQTIVLKAGLHAIGEKKMPDTGKPAKFKIKVPAANISDEDVSVLFVSEKTGGLGGKSVRVEVQYIERQKQEISTASSKYELTYPGTEVSINAKSSSGEKLIYSSSDPEIASVDEDGVITPLGNGDVEITVKQIGSSAYEETEKTVNVSVEEIAAYTVTFHASIDGVPAGSKPAGDTETKKPANGPNTKKPAGNTAGADEVDDEEDGGEDVVKQIIPTDKQEALEANPFENGTHKFLGWATEDGGLVEYDDGQIVSNLAAQGGNTDLYAVWTGDGAVAAVKWAIDIANDDSFTYGKKPAANAIGCYFCGTNKKNKPKGYEKTYVCLTFVAAAYAHGAEDPEVYWACSHGKMPLYENDYNFSQFSCWTKIGKCKNLNISDLQPGDVVIHWSDHNDNNGHVWMYCGGDTVVESGGSGFTARSISAKSGAAKRLKSYGNNNKNYVMRYTGPNAKPIPGYSQN